MFYEAFMFIILLTLLLYGTTVRKLIKIPTVQLSLHIITILTWVLTILLILYGVTITQTTGSLITSTLKFQVFNTISYNTYLELLRFFLTALT